MRRILFPLTLVVLPLFVGLSLCAQEAAPSTPAPARHVSLSPVQMELQKVVAAIKTKVRSGARNEAALSEELKGFDRILESHKDGDPEELSRVLLMKAMLYVEVLKELDKGEELILQLKADYPQTEVGQKAESLLAMIGQLRESEKIQASMKQGNVFPDFDEKDMAGEPLSIGKFKGKVVLIDFWATWCPPCVAELPNVRAAYEKYHDKGFEIVGISLDQDATKLKAFIAEKHMTWPQYFDGKGWGNKLSQRYGIRSIPTTFLVDAEGKIVARDLRGAALEAELEKLLGK